MMLAQGSRSTFNAAPNPLPCLYLSTPHRVGTTKSPGALRRCLIRGRAERFCTNKEDGSQIPGLSQMHLPVSHTSNDYAIGHQIRFPDNALRPLEHILVQLSSTVISCGATGEDRHA